MSISIASLKKRFHNYLSNPARVIVTSFALLVLVGALLLMLPVSSRSGIPLSPLDALFTATSASCVTGLVVRDTFTAFSLFGQVVLLLLIQLGGLGLVTFATFFNLALRKRIGLKNLYVAQESVGSDRMSEMARLTRTIFLVTFAFEGTGALLLMLTFVPKYGVYGVFISIFLAVSSYCNAGFDPLGFEKPFTSLSNYTDQPMVLVPVMLLIICGGLGFIVWQELFYFRKNRKLSFHTRIVLIFSGALVLLGALLFGLLEWSNPDTLGGMSGWEKILNSFFLSVSSRTAGFNTVPIEELTGTTKLLHLFWMFIGAAPGSTGGGVKVTTVFVLLMTVVSVMSGKEDTIIGKHRVEKSAVYKAMAVVSAAFLVVAVSTACIFFTSHQGGATFSEIDALFESVSAFGTVGISVGVTGIANTATRMFLILTMFIGRVGPGAMALSLAMRPERKKTVLPEARIMVG